MISKLSRNRLQELASRTELYVDAKTGILFGKRQGYDICLRVMDNTYKAILSFSVSRNQGKPQADEFIRLTKEHKFLSSCRVFNYGVAFIINSAMTKNKCIDAIVDSVNAVLRYLQLNGYENCCQACGARENVSPHILNGAEVILCPVCVNAHSYATEIQNEETRKNQNAAAGIVGALIGSLLGVLSIVIFGQLGYVASVSGLIMAVCTIKGYELLGKRLGNLGIVFSSIIILLMIYVGCQLDWAITVMSYFEIDIFTAFRAVSDSTVVDRAAFTENLMMLYLFAIVGAVPTIWQVIRQKKDNSITHKMERDF